MLQRLSKSFIHQLIWKGASIKKLQRVIARVREKVNLSLTRKNLLFGYSPIRYVWQTFNSENKNYQRLLGLLSHSNINLLGFKIGSKTFEKDYLKSCCTLILCLPENNLLTDAYYVRKKKQFLIICFYFSNILFSH